MNQQHDIEFPHGLNRRQMLATLSSLGIGSVVFQRALAAAVEKPGAVTAEMIQQAEWIAGLELPAEERVAVASHIQSALDKFQAMRGVKLGYDEAPAMFFAADPHETHNAGSERGTVRMIESAAAQLPEKDEDLAFLPVTELSALIKTRQISSLELTELYLERLHRFDEVLQCVVSFTDELALRQAKRADREIAAGRYRGPLHGIPWGAKDLIAYPGYKTTWGALPFKDQTLDVKATVARRLDEAGAVLVAKLSLGALAWGDQWFGGMTRNPWNTKQGSSGSSAGSASATAAGLCGFTIGSETLGSIVSPCRRCGTSGLRPTFGRVSRFGCMPLAWSMDKLGPIARSIEDCAIVFGIIHGRDGLDPTAVDRPFHWPLGPDVRTLRVGYFENGLSVDERDDLRVLKEIGVKLVAIKLPDNLPVGAMTIILNTEAASVFDELTRNNVTEGLNRWPNALRQGEFVPAVEYLRANRLRTRLMKEMNEAIAGVDLYVNGNDLSLTNLTGHPTAVLPSGFHEQDGVKVPHSITFTGNLFRETELLAVAHAYQQTTGVHLQRPDLSATPADE